MSSVASVCLYILRDFQMIIPTNILADAVADYRRGINEFNYIHLNIQNRYKMVMY